MRGDVLVDVEPHASEVDTVRANHPERLNVRTVVKDSDDHSHPKSGKVTLLPTSLTSLNCGSLFTSPVARHGSLV